MIYDIKSVSRDQLQLDLEIEKTTQRNKIKKRKEKRGELLKNLQPRLLVTLNQFKKKATWLRKDNHYPKEH